MSYYEGIQQVKYEGRETENKFAFRHYDPNEVISGKTMKEHMRFAIAYWHTMTESGADPFGDATKNREWESADEMETAKERVNVFFEILEKLGVEYFCFHDVDIAPQGNSIEEFFENLDVITDIMKEKMDKTGIKLLWNTANLFSNPRYVHGAATSPNVDAYAFAAAQVKKSLELSKKLNGENFVFWGGREGYISLLNTDMKMEEENLATFFKIAHTYTEEINHKVQFLLEPKPKEPTTHQYDFDAATTLSFLQKYDLADIFKLNLEANHATLAGHTFEHELQVARINNSLGSVDANQGDMLLGWDTDEFPTDLYMATLAMYEVVENGGIAPGGINFDAKTRRSSFEKDDLILSHIVGMDTYARAFKVAMKMKENKFFDNIKAERYESFNSELGQKIINKNITIQELADYARKNQNVVNTSDELEYIKSRINDLIF